MKQAVSKFLSFINTNMNPFESRELKFETYAFKTHSVFHRFKQAKFACDDLILSLWQFFLLLSLPQNLMQNDDEKSQK
jgi:hypothetical protein